MLIYDIALLKRISNKLARIIKHPKYYIIFHVIWEILSILQPIYKKQFSTF